MQERQLERQRDNRDLIGLMENIQSGSGGTDAGDGTAPVPGESSSPLGISLPTKRSRRRKVRYSDIVYALRLREDGYTPHEIAAKLNLHVAVVEKALAAAQSWYRRQLEDAEGIYRLIMFRLERAVKAIMPKVAEGDPNAIRALMDISRLQAKLSGVEQNVQVDRTAEAVWKKLAKELGLFSTTAEVIAIETDASHDPDVIESAYPPLNPPGYDEGDGYDEDEDGEDEEGADDVASGFRF
jgi:hypothetical protein